MPYMGAMQQRIEDAAGSTGFMYSDWNQNRQEMWMRDGSVVGQYAYRDADGKPVVTYFDAGKQGFRVRSNNLPEAPVAEHLTPLYEAPKPVEDTPEVAEVKRVMAELHTKASSRTKRQVAPQWMYPIKTTTFPLASYNPYFYSSIMNPLPIMPASSWNEMVTKPVVKSRKRREADPVWPAVYMMSPAAAIQTQHLTPVPGRMPAATTKLQMTYGNPIAYSHMYWPSWN
ncbi:Cuticle protein 6 [Chionoecetes opilio]|uniref:Cuticle protein 6 n=1 Tax=Chionoecetes opilio TaxID=41210 RepID=A0A8J4XLD6_CHIOP|nr:Cuticle protein 6 [Chionoecetes opilio]